MHNSIKAICPAYLLFIAIYFCGCDPNPERELDAVSYAQFEQFVLETGYVTDAERFGWSIVQTDVFNFEKVNGANWKKPDGINPVNSKTLPVTQVSYNDAMAYCEWSGFALPTYEQYWELIKPDMRTVVTNNNAPISSVAQVNVLGNVWDLTKTVIGNDVRLAGGSLFCSPTICHGTTREREMYVDKQTGNIHIGFAVVSP